MTSLRPWLAMLPLLAACPVDDDESLDLADRTFLSQSVTEGGVDRELVGTKNLRLRFFEPPRVGASAACNTLDATYELVDGALVLADAAQTAIGCPQANGEQDDWYFSFLLSSPDLTLDGDSLVLEGGGVRIEYLDEEIAAPDLPLVGPTWTADTIIDGMVAQGAQWSSPATFELAEDGTVRIFTGCNSGSGTYAVQGANLTFMDVSVTERGCGDDSAQMMETATLALVFGPQPVTWDIDVTRLSLRNADGGLDLVGTGG